MVENTNNYVGVKKSDNSNKRFILSYNNRQEVLTLPVNPSEFEDANSHNVEPFTTYQLGTINIIGRTALRTMVISSFFPNQAYSFCTYKNFPPPYECKNMILRWKESNRPIRVIVTGTDINTAYAITNFSTKEQDGTGDLYFTLELLEYKFNNVPSSSNSFEIDEWTGLRRRPYEKGNRVILHTFVQGDSLWSLAERYYGNGELWTEIAGANSVEDPWRMKQFLGKELMIP